MGKLRPRFNAKARASCHTTRTAKPHPNARDGGIEALRSKLKRKIARRAKEEPPAGSDQRPAIETYEVVEASEAAKPAPLEAILAQLPEAPDGKISRQKRKRLEKYIEKQLDKEKRIEVTRRLAENVFRSDLFKSSKDLGRKKMTRREKHGQVFREQRDGVVVTAVEEREELEESESEDPPPESEKLQQQLTSKLGFTRVIGPALKKARVVSEDNSKKDSDDDLPDSSDSCWDSDEDEEDKEDQQQQQERAPPTPAKTPTPQQAPEQQERKPQEPQPTPSPAFYVQVDRPEHIQAARLALPVVGEEQRIMEAVAANDVVILCGETGSGKTTQVPQFLYEHGFSHREHPLYPGMIGVTQPRRVAAVSMAKRLSEEMGLSDGAVAYQVRYDSSTVTPATRVKLMTDGILMREIVASRSSDSSEAMLLSKYSCIVIDEAHERTLNTDVLIGWLSRIARFRNSGRVAGVRPLKLVIMSATLRVEDFVQNTRLFPSSSGENKMRVPEVIRVDGRQFKVTVHYNRKTPDDYVSEAAKKVYKIHTRLPHGGILVFLTGQREIELLTRKLRELFPDEEKRRKKEAFRVQEDGALLDDEARDDLQLAERRSWDDSAIEEAAIDLESDEEGDEEDQVQVLDGLEADMPVELPSASQSIAQREKAPLHILPLYSLLSTKEQMRVFEHPPAGARLCVIATNVAETSLTIPGIKYVVDCGKAKEKTYDQTTGIERFRVAWTSQSSADQRAGRAGRIAPGHCYRLFSSAVFGNYFPPFSPPEILKMPADGLVLSMKAMGIENVAQFPLPTPPDAQQLKKAERLLVQLGALDKEKSRITALGELMAKFPVAPRFGKLLVLASEQDKEVLPFVVAIVAGLSVGDPFVRDSDIMETQADGEESAVDADDKQRRQAKRKRFWQLMETLDGKEPTSDLFRLLGIIGAYESFRARSGSDSKDKTDAFCRDHFVMAKTMSEIHELRAQLTSLCARYLGSSTSGLARPPTRGQKTLVRQLVLLCFFDQTARLCGVDRNGRARYEVMHDDGGDSLYSIHAGSVLASEGSPPPQLVVYLSLKGRQERCDADNKTSTEQQSSRAVVALMHNTAVDDAWIAKLLHAPVVAVSKVLDKPRPFYAAKEDRVRCYANLYFGPKNWELAMRDIPWPEDDFAGKVRWFAAFLLEGKVFSEKKSVFSILEPLLISKPSSIVKTWAATQMRVQSVLAQLTGKRIASRAALLAEWRVNKRFLLDAYLLWVPKSVHDEVAKAWPPVEVTAHGGYDCVQMRSLARMAAGGAASIQPVLDEDDLSA